MKQNETKKFILTQKIQRHLVMMTASGTLRSGEQEAKPHIKCASPLKTGEDNFNLILKKFIIDIYCGHAKGDGPLAKIKNYQSKIYKILMHNIRNY